MAPEPIALPAPRRSSGRRPGPGRPRRDLPGPALAFLLTAGSFTLAWMLRGSRPFGGLPRALNDQANQYVPFHQGLWDLVHGEAAGDLLFSWRSGYGQQFLADHHTYLGNPLSWLAVLVPRDRVDLAVFALTPLTLGLAAAAMTLWLGRLAPGPGRLRALLGTCYGLCGWAAGDASYIPMWQWGLVALPLLGIAAEWCREGRRLPSAALLVALAWLGNFYTAMMATAAAGIVLVVRLTVVRAGRRQWIHALLRAAAAAGTGVLLTFPLLLPAALASGASQPTRAGAFEPVGTAYFLMGLLPGSYHWGGHPRLYVASLGLVLALAFLLDPAVARRTRLAWGGAAVLTAASFQFPPTQYAWHGLAVPNGNPYREAFVLSALLVVLAWLGLAARPRPGRIAAALGILAAAAAALHRADDFTPWTWAAVLGGGALSVAGLCLYLRGSGPHRRRALAAAGVLVMAAAVCAESAGSVLTADVRRARESWAAPRTTAGPEAAARFAAVRSADGWPAHRTDPGSPELSYNDGLALRAEGPQYYSSHLPAAAFRALAPLGYGWKNDGRTLFGADNPVLDAVFGVGARVRPGPGGTWRADRFPAPPLVTVRGRRHAPAHPAGSVWARQEAVLSSAVYEVPRTVRTPGTGYTARCTPGTEAHWYSPALTGRLRYGSRSVALAGPRTGVVRLGPVPTSGRVDVAAETTGGTAPGHAVGCLDRAALTAAVRRLTADGATAVRAGGHSLTAELPAGAAGTAVFATTAVPGWRCSAPRVAFHGLLAVDLPPGTREVSCTFLPRGLPAGLAAGGAALLLLAAGTLHGLRRRV
ncbi:YfhO family protein [Streptomyces bambusae]|uniref:YfhO family protein n=1 Tax=Streptomyces bambusae TaxID=1550616 RepID=UPI001CFCE3BC|nr:YfhO family protein [Streptomyces bambusae]MCB5165967.1 YfhO family protein [Streptomyces bambusae]